MPPPVKYSKAVKLNRKELAGVIEAFAQEGSSPGYAAWRKACAKGLRSGKLDESSVDDCITYVCQEVKKRAEDNEGHGKGGNSDSKLTSSELRKMQSQMKKHAEKFI